MTHAASLRLAFAESLGGILPVDRLFDGVPDIVFFVKDAAGRYMAVNDTLAHRCGLTEKPRLPCAIRRADLLECNPLWCPGSTPRI